MWREIIQIDIFLDERIENSYDRIWKNLAWISVDIAVGVLGGFPENFPWIIIDIITRGISE